MQTFVMLEQPGLLLLYGLGLLCGVMDRKQRASGGWLTWIGAAAAVAAAALLVLYGAGLWEAAAWLMGFLLTVMGVKE